MDLCRPHLCNINACIHHTNELSPHHVPARQEMLVTCYRWDFKTDRIMWFIKTTGEFWWLRYFIWLSSLSLFPFASNLCLQVYVCVYNNLTFYSILLLLRSPLTNCLFFLTARKKKYHQQKTHSNDNFSCSSRNTVDARRNLACFPIPFAYLLVVV